MTGKSQQIDLRGFNVDRDNAGALRRVHEDTSAVAVSDFDHLIQRGDCAADIGGMVYY